MNTEKKAFWSADYQVRMDETLMHGRLSPVALFNYMQDAATQHANHFDVSVMEKNGRRFTWVLSRMKYYVERYPKQEDKVTIQTFLAGTRKLYVHRKFKMFDKKGVEFGHAESAWVVIDIDSRRPSRARPFLEDIGMAELSVITEDPFLNITEIEYESNDYLTLPVRFHDIDINNHVNNVSYVGWVVDSAPQGILKCSEAAEIELQYLGEAFLDDTVLSYTSATDENIVYHKLMNQNTGKELLRGKTTWRRF